MRLPPTGTASFVIDGGSPVKVVLDDTGHASFATSTLTMGKHTEAVSYSGDMKYKPSSGSLTETIVGPPASLSSVSGSGQSAVYGVAFAKPLTVLVRDEQGGVAPGVLVSFSGTGLRFRPTLAMTNESSEAEVVATAAAIDKLTAIASVSNIKTPADFNLQPQRQSSL